MSQNSLILAPLAATLLFVTVSKANAEMYITEWMYSGNGGEYVEFTNVGNVAIDMTGWSYDDDSNIPGVLNLSAFGIVQPGESVVITEDSAADFRNDWGLDASVKIIGNYTNNLGRNDQINLYNNLNALVDRLTYGDETFAGSIRTQEISGNFAFADLGLNFADPHNAFFSQAGDIFGSWQSANGDFGNPGVYVVPAPTALALLGFGAASTRRRRRA
jgi:hypothetical protein